MLPHEKTKILGCKSVKLLYFIPMLPIVVQSMIFHLHADLPYCGLKRLNSENPDAGLPNTLLLFQFVFQEYGRVSSTTIYP